MNGRAKVHPEVHPKPIPKGVLTPEQRADRAPKRNEAQREVDRLTILRMLKRGMTQVEIAEQVGLSQQQISYDVRIVFRELAEHRNKLTEELVAVRELQYGELLRMFWEQWDKSIQESEKGIGNIEWLRGIERIYDKLNHLQGLYPTREMSIKGTVTTTEATVNWDVLAGITDGRVPDEVEEQIRKVVEALPDSTGGRPRKDIGPQQEESK